MASLLPYLGFAADTREVLRNLNSDFYDEWFYDCLSYQDYLKSNSEVIAFIEAEVMQGVGRYPAAPRIIRNIPKKGLPVRYSLETDFLDRFVYQAITTFLIKFFDPHLSHRVLSHRFARHSKRYLFQNRIERWLTYEGVSFTFRRDSKYLLVTDLANYYENIRSSDIIESLEGLLPSISAGPNELQEIRNAIELLRSCLERWTFNGEFGLPQNRDASAFFANVLLASVDRKMEQLGYDYYRYVDDIRIICDSVDEAKKSLHELISGLREIGLNVNSAKTAILGPDTSNDEIAKHFAARDPRVVAIEQMWKSRSRAIILKSIKYLIELIEECIEQEETQSRQFRFAANRLAQLSEIGVLNASQLKSDLAGALLESMLDQPASTDQFCKILDLIGLASVVIAQIEDFLSDRDRSIHDWQNYHLWMLLAKNSVKTPKLRSSALACIAAGDESAESAAILIWADQVGYKSVINAAIKNFPDNPSFQFQRYFAIATRRLPNLKVNHLYSRISSRIRGTRERVTAFEDGQGRLRFPKREVSIRNLFDEVSEYD